MEMAYEFPNITLKKNGFLELNYGSLISVRLYKFLAQQEILLFLQTKISLLL